MGAILAIPLTISAMKARDIFFSENGNEAIRLYQEAINTNNTFDLVIMDLTIPGGMDGKEAVQEILNLDPDAKVIVSSGYSNDPVMANFKDYGFCSAIAKPYQLQELSKVINQLIDWWCLAIVGLW